MRPAVTPSPWQWHWVMVGGGGGAIIAPGNGIHGSAVTSVICRRHHHRTGCFGVVGAETEEEGEKMPANLQWLMRPTVTSTCNGILWRTRHLQDSSDLMLTQADGTHSGHWTECIPVTGISQYSGAVFTFYWDFRPGDMAVRVSCVCVAQTLLLRCSLPMNADGLSS